MSRSVSLCGVTGHDLRVMGKTQLNEQHLGPIDVIVVDGIRHPMILGRDLLTKFEALVDYSHGILSMIVHDFPLLPIHTNPSLESLGERPPRVVDTKVGECVERFKDLFAAKGENLGCHPDIMVRIETEGRPIKRRPYRIPLAKRAALDDKLVDLLQQGVIVPSSSPWASPVVLVAKKDPSEGPRFCVDFTAVNKITKKDAYPIPLIRDIFDQLQGAAVFSTLDLKSGFHQLPIHPEDQEKTAFVCHRGLFECTRMPMGLSNASQMFQRAMEVVLKGLIGTICLIYIDDIVVFSRNEAEHVRHLETMFERLAQYNLRLNPTKCVFGLRQVKLLGYVVSENGLSADPDKVAAIARLQNPKSVAEIRTFLGMTGYYRNCIQNYAHIAEPLVELTRKNYKFAWSDRQQQAFDTLKAALMSDTVMAHPDTQKPYLLYTDACDYAIGAILCQTDEHGTERPVVYLSKQLSPQQRKWATIEKEAYAVVHALTQLRPYLWGAQYRTFTDHKPLTSLFTKSMNNTKIQRWAILLSEYGCKVEYHKGKLNVRADMLSRIRQEETINTFDTDYWQLGDQMPPLPPDEQLPNTYGLDLHSIAQQQRTMDEWQEQHNDDSEYIVINNLLYSTRRPYRYAPDHPRLVLPPQHRQQVIKSAHQDVGHMSVIRTMRKLHEAFAWPYMKRDVTAYISKCPACVTHSKVTPRCRMGEMPIATCPGQIVAADLIGPLVKSPDNNQYILTVLDHCTGYAEAFAIKCKASQEVWKQLTRYYFPRHGYPDVFLTDKGLEFTASALTDYLRTLGIEHRQSTPYNPQSNGKIERFNGTLKAIIAKQINNNRASWEDQLAPALMAYNNSVSDATSHTPFFLHHARRARLPISRLLHAEQTLDQRLLDVSAALRTAISETYQARKYNRERLAKRANQGIIKVGDTVVVKAMEPLSLTSKWDPQWTVIAIKDKVVTLMHQQTSQQKVLNINKVRVVDPNIVWDDVNPRPKRNSRKSTRDTGLQADNNNTRMLHIPAPPQRNNASGRVQAKKRMRTDDRSPEPPATKDALAQGDNTPQTQHADTTAPPVNSSRTPSLIRKAALTSPQDTKRLHRAATKRPAQQATTASAKRPAPPPTKPDPAVHKSTAVTRKAAQSTADTKRLHRQAPRRPALPSHHLPQKRARPFLPRGTKRPIVTNIRKPSPQVQKRQRIDLIELVSQLAQW